MVFKKFSAIASTNFLVCEEANIKYKFLWGGGGAYLLFFIGISWGGGGGGGGAFPPSPVDETPCMLMQSFNSVWPILDSLVLLLV